MLKSLIRIVILLMSQAMLSIFFASDVCTQDIVKVRSDANKNQLILKNIYIETAFDLDRGANLVVLNDEKTRLLLTEYKEDTDSIFLPGNSLVLYASHPLSSSHTIALPTSFAFEKLSPRDATTARIRLKSISGRGISLTKEVSLHSHQAILTVTSTLRNTGDRPLTFYPTEITAINTEFGESGLPNRTFHFYCPYVPISKDETGIRVTLGMDDNPQFRTIRDNQLFFTRYQHRIGEVKFDSDKNWFAFQNGTNGIAYAVEYEFPGRRPETAKDNVIFHTNGAGEFMRDGILRTNEQNVQPYMRLSNVLGQVTLAPGESFTYLARWSSSTCMGPILDVKNGVLFNTHLGVQTREYDLYVYGSMGIPQEGTVGFHLLDESGRILGKIYNITLVLELGHRRPSKAVLTHPTIVTHAINVGVDVNDLATQSGQSIYDKTQKVQMVLVDSNQRPIMIVDESTRPWEKFQSETD